MWVDVVLHMPTLLERDAVFKAGGIVFSFL